MDVLKAIPTYSPDVIFNDCSAVIPGLIKLSIPNQYIIVNTDEGDIKYSIKRVSVDKLLVTEMENNNNEDIGQDANGS